MRVAVNAVANALGGGITVLRNLVPSLAQYPENHLTVFCHPAAEAALRPIARSNIQVLSPIPPRAGLVRRLFWEQFTLPKIAEGFDVLLSMSNVAVIGARIPQVLVFQNVAPHDPVTVAMAPSRKAMRLSMLRFGAYVSAIALMLLCFYPGIQGS